MSLSQRIAVKLLETIGLILWGFRPNLMRHIVEQHGALPSIGWFVRNMPGYEHEIVTWHAIDEDETAEQLRRLIHASDLSSELPFFERMLLLRQGTQQPASEDDKKLEHLIKMFAFLNRCGIRGKTTADRAHDPIDRDTSLQNEYHRLRRAETAHESAST